VVRLTPLSPLIPGMGIGTAPCVSISDALLPSRGYYAKAFNELAGFGPLKGDVSFWKSEIEVEDGGWTPVQVGREDRHGIQW
jgi:hypothetical protein